MTAVDTLAEIGVLRSAACPADRPDAAAELARALHAVSDPLDCVILFAGPEADLTALAAAAAQAFGGARIVGCSTAGEISEDGYTEGQVVALGLPASHFRTESLLIDDIHRSPIPDLTARVLAARAGMRQARPSWVHEFAFMMIDGLSLREDQVASEISASLGPMPLFGGSAGDGDRFAETRVLLGGKVLTDAAVLLMVRTRCPVRVFKTDHLLPSRKRMVVTGADPDHRIVHEINGAPAGQEYARILGKDPGQLDTFTFAAHPVVLRIGEQHHVRSIRQVLPNGDLVFFSAIGEGLVLSLADTMDMEQHLEAELSALAGERAPLAILACDCILRKLEAEQKQMTGRLSAVMARHGVRGFSTYGEQMGGMHVNQTMTGVAIYPPEAEGGEA